GESVKTFVSSVRKCGKCRKNRPMSCMLTIPIKRDDRIGQPGVCAKRDGSGRALPSPEERAGTDSASMQNRGASRYIPRKYRPWISKMRCTPQNDAIQATGNTAARN